MLCEEKKKEYFKRALEWKFNKKKVHENPQSNTGLAC
jgi:hypothetical protein